MSPLLTIRTSSGRSAGDGLGTCLVLDPAHASDLSPIAIVPGRICIGSGPDCDVRLSVRGVAEHHCLLVAGPTRAVVKSLAPRTWLNDGLVRESQLRTGDRRLRPLPPRSTRKDP